MSDRKCYMCDKMATSDEHVPPRCIFPEQNDVGEDYRKNLITVPSCDEHNMRKSDDDEFLMAFITAYINNNDLGYRQTMTKLKRSVARNVRLIDRVMQNAKSINVKTVSGEIFPILTGKPNVERLKKCIDYISQGLYFKEFGQRFTGKITVIFEFVKYRDSSIDEIRANFLNIYEKEAGLYPVKGANPKVFFYQMTTPNKFGIVGLRMTFFEGTHFLVSMHGAL